MHLSIDTCICSTAITSLYQIVSYWEQVIESESAESSFGLLHLWIEGLSPKVAVVQQTVHPSDKSGV